MSNTQQMRNELYLKYKGKRWRERVLAMADDQIVAIWYSFQKRSVKNQEKKVKKQKEKAIQLRLF